MAVASPDKPVLTRPASPRFVAATLGLALLLDLLPWNGTVALLLPDFVALALIYWIVHAPRRVGLVIAWLLGLIVDIAEGSLFGQHALGYLLMAYATWRLHRRLQGFGLWPQALYVLGLLLWLDAVMLLARLAFGSVFPGLLYFAGAVTGALLWPLLSWLLSLSQRGKPNPDNAFSAAGR